MFKKLKPQILSGYLALALLSTFSAGFAWFFAIRVQTQAQLAQTAHTLLENGESALIRLDGMDEVLLVNLLDQGKVPLSGYQQAEMEFNQLLRELLAMVQDSTQKQRLERIRDLAQRLIQSDQSILALLQEGKQEEAIVLWKSRQVAQQKREIAALLRQFEEAERTIVIEHDREQTNALNRLKLIVVSFALVSALLALWLGWLIASTVAQRMQQSASAIASASTEIATTVEQQERTASQQAASVNQTTTTMDELNASSRQSAEQAAAAAASARQALTLAEEGTQAVGQTIEGMMTLKEKVDAIAAQISRLSGQTSQIGNISSLVSDLANQTNMLALNAAVEAVRAGEHGKGFAVVAAEIRKLADQSKSSAEKIYDLVNDIQTAINSTVMVTDEGSKTVEAGVDIAQGTSRAFAGVTDAVNNVFLNNQQISLNIKQQAIAIQQVVEAMNALNTAAQESATGISQVRVGTQQLNETALKLRMSI